MTFELAIMMAFAGAVGLASFVAALWGALDSGSTLARLRQNEADEESILLAKIMAFRANGRAFLIVVLSSIAVIRLASADLLVTTSTYVMFTLLLIAQIVVGLFVLLDVYERTSIFPGENEDDED